ncbi:MAG: PAS domain S-box protein [Halobacteriaceae archaeon]
MDGLISILHVDDDPDFVDLAASFLERQDDRFTVETATSVTEARERMDETEFDCIISDYEMPNYTGIDFLQMVREDHPDLPVILFTGKGSEEIASEAISEGVTEYIQKEGGTSQYTVLANRIHNAVEKYRAQTELRIRDRRLNALLEHSSDRIFILDEDGNYDWVSPAMERITGFAPDELIGESSREYIHPDDRAKVRENFQRLVSGAEDIVTQEYRVRTKDGSWLWVETIEKNRLNDPAIEGVIANSRDISARKEREQQLKQERDRFESLFEILPDPVALVTGDPDGNATVNRVNPAFEDVFGYENDEIVGEDLDELVVPEERVEKAKQIGKDAVEGDLISTTVRRQTADGDLREFMLFATVFAETKTNDKDAVGAVVMYSEVTDERQQRYE